MLFFWGNSFAQISLSINQQTIKQIIPQIEKTSGYNVFYTDKLPNLDTRKDLLVSNAPLEATLKELFKGTKITFEIKPNKQVLLFQQANKPSVAIGNKYPASYWWKQKALTERGDG
ncbi:STN domain-containing protein [Bacteroides uniformis]|nr:STN domain-containing protein [Bacteroides uniformis]